MKVRLQMLGQVGCILQTPQVSVLIDPYLSDSVAERFGPKLRRMVPVPFTGSTCPHVDVLLLTHSHMDHTDPETLRELLAAQPHMRIFAPVDSREVLRDLGCADAEVPPVAWTALGGDSMFRAVPAAHTEVRLSASGECRDVGYVLKLGGTIVYHAGDTIPATEIFRALKPDAVDLALLPVNERNYYRDAEDIIGNMTVREAFRMAADLGARTLVPTHWDMFEPNAAFPEEIELLHRLLAPPFALRILPVGGVLEF